jgi:hypothetical protein
MPRAAALQDRSPKGAEPFAPPCAAPAATCEGRYEASRSAKTSVAMRKPVTAAGTPA